MLSPESAQSLILAIGAGCFGVWGWRKSGPPAIFGALYLVFPAIGLACQAAGWIAVVEPGKWVSVVATAAITGPLLYATVRGHALGSAAIQIERDRRARWAQEDAQRAIRERLANERAEYHRGRCYAVAEMIEARA